MIETVGPRLTATSGPAAAVPNGQPGEKIVHRPPTRVLPAEPVDRMAPTGPRPAFKHTYLEQAAAYWPDEPDPPVTRIDHEPPVAEPAPPPEARAAEEGLTALRTDGAQDPLVDIRR